MYLEDKPLTIAFVTTEFVSESNFDGGLSNYLQRVALSLKQLGHNPIIIVTSEQKGKIEYKGIPVYRVKNRKNYLIGGINRLTWRKFNLTLGGLLAGWKLNQELIEINKKNQISLVQYPSCGYLGLFRSKDIPSFVRVSSYLPLWNQAYQLERNLDITTIEKLEEIAYTKTDALFAPSYLNAKAVEAATGKAVTVIETPFILDTLDLDDKLYQAHLKDKKYLLFFGTIGLMKGCGLIAEIIYELLEKYSDLYFVLVGKDTGYLGYKGVSLVNKIKENTQKNRDRVIHFEPLSHPYLYPIIAQAYAVILPSRVDNFPNTCLEAMAHKKVVVGTNGTSFEQLITDGFSGFLCEKDNPQDLLTVIDKVLNISEQQRLEIGERAYQRIQELSPEKVVNQLVDFYRQVIEKKYA